MKNVMRTGFVRVASSKGDRIYGSLDDMPEPLRDRARRTLGGPDATVIMIADPEAYEWIERMEQSVTTEAGPTVPRSPTPAAPSTPTVRDPEADREWKVLLLAGGGAILTLWALWLWAIRSSM